VDPSWSETGDRYLLKLFRDHVFHNVTADGRPSLDMSHIIHSMNRLDAGAMDKVAASTLWSQDILFTRYSKFYHIFLFTTRCC